MTTPMLLQWFRQVATQRNQAIPVAMCPTTAVLEEAAFVQVVRFERRRTERSGKQLMLVLVSSEEFRGKSGPAFANTVVTGIASCIRETDVLGWYQRDAALGILLTEVGSLELLTIDTIMCKLSHNIAKHVGAENFLRLTLDYRLFPDCDEVCPKHGKGQHFYPDLSARHTGNMQAPVAKRLTDIVGSLIALLFFVPLFVLVAALVSMTSDGPVLFCQQRVGRHGQLFKFFKFRTMYVNNDQHIHQAYITRLIAGEKDMRGHGGLYKLAHDPRVTPVGRFLRRSSLDELPQFFNVLIGDMSLVGPRPPLPYEFERYQVWHRRRVMELKPGLTGPWQVGGRSTTTFDEMVRIDLRYASKHSFWTDCAILLQTPTAVLSGRGAC